MIHEETNEDEQQGRKKEERKEENYEGTFVYEPGTREIWGDGFFSRVMEGCERGQ